MATLTADPTDPIAPSPADMVIAREAARLLALSLATPNGTVRLHVEDPNISNDAVIVPTVAFRLLVRILNELGDGNTVRVIAGHTELTTGEIAELLNVSRPYAIKLLDEGQIASYRVGTHRRARLQDVLDYRNEHYTARKAVLDQMSAIDQELGLI